MKPDISASWLPLVGVAALWTPAMLAASYVWGHGEYYDYGWFVPPAALWLMVRRWQSLDGPVTLPRRQVVLASAAVLLPWVLVLRVLGYADPSWRLPMVLLGMTAAGLSHGLIAVTRGGRVSAGFVWITLLWLSALPWPSAVETRLVHTLTQGVVTAVAEVFQMFGRPVEVLGDRLRLQDLTVEVTDGCSGVRSFQSFVMATWFFAELQRLRAARALTLLACACVVAFVVNMARTYALAQIRFEYGKAAFDQAHNALGLLAFGISGWCFYVLSGRLSAKHRRMVVRTVQSH
ncbi:MAG: exosortase/archaeosortase family protein [Verrucomicrobia bacterium]|nr:exosortase/archaeosortase family protein [Verrucomicrobiota bacterium]